MTQDRRAGGANGTTDAFGDEASDETTHLKKKARRRLIGAAALALLAIIVLPMVMDHQPPPALKDIQVRIPSPDEGMTQPVSPKPIAPRKEERPAVAEAPVAPQEKLPVKIDQKSVPPETKVESKPEPKVEPKPEAKIEPRTEPKAEPKPEAAAKRTADEAWEVQLGAYQESGRVKLLVGKLKELGVPNYTEQVETPAGMRTRVRAGPFPTQEAAEKARARIKIIGVDGPVARKP